ncbi:MAG: response regulator transcription factor [Geminicoccaceae bacterium]
MRVLIIEDDKAVAEYVRTGLVELGHTVDVAHDGRDGLFMASSEPYDAVIVDMMLPTVDGLTILNALRASKIGTPMLVLSAKSKVQDRVQGLRAGADDYLVKPFAFEELLARLEVIVSRGGARDERATTLSAYDLEVDLLALTVTRGGKAIELHATEFKLLDYLLRHKGQVVTRTMILEHVWDYNFDPQTNIIDVHISRLRQKIDKGQGKAVITTVRGAGYKVPADA